MSGKEQCLHSMLRTMGKVAIAFSGGTDSTLLAEAARRAVGAENVLLLHAVSVLLPDSDRCFAPRWAAEAGIPFLEVAVDPLADEAVRRNDPLRCYYCKTLIFKALHAAALERGFARLADGANCDDLGDYRPGMRAAAELGVAHPLIDGGFAKEDVRALARAYGLANAGTPASACLASRIPTGTPLDEAALQRIGRAEAALGALGFSGVRVRVYGTLAKLEVPPGQLEEAFRRREEIVKLLREAGFRDAALDLAGYRMGAMNAVLSE